MAQRSAPRYQAPLAQHLMFAFYAFAFYVLVFGGGYLAFDRWNQESLRKTLTENAIGWINSADGVRPANWVRTINITRINNDNYQIQASLTPPEGDPNPTNLAPVTLDVPIVRQDSTGILVYNFRTPKFGTSGAIREEVMSKLLTPLMKRYGMMLIPLVLFGLFWLVVWIKFLNKAGYPSYYALIPGVNLFYGYTMMTDSLPKAWLLFIGSFIPGINAIVWIIGCLGLAKNFGRSGGFAVGLMFMPMIFIAILAFGKSKYQPEGPTEED